MHVLVAVCLVASAGCLRQTQYQCSGDTSCGVAGRCETSGFCSFVDEGCASGRRYNDTAGASANQCVDGNEPMADAAVTLLDAPPTDATPTDAPVGAGCPTGYVALAGGQAGHLYKLVSAADEWPVQQADCRLTTASAYLAIPDDIAELQALDTAAGATAIYWVGISDRDTEMQWRTVLDAAQTFLPWLAPAPDDQNPGEDCVAAIADTHNFNDARCNTKLPAICECAP